MFRNVSDAKAESDTAVSLLFFLDFFVVVVCEKCLLM